MKELGVLEAAQKVGDQKKKDDDGAKKSSRKRPAAATSTTTSNVPERRSSRARMEVSYKEPTMKELESAMAAAIDDDERASGGGTSAGARKGYNPPAPKVGFTPALVLTEGKRDKKTGALIFEDHPEFRPNLTPAQVIRAGSWGGCYFHPKGGKPGVKHPKEGVKIDHKEFPAEWFKGLKPESYRARRYNKSTNKYGVVAGQDQAFWEEKGWIIEQDPRGWFQWYCRFYTGRRSNDDKRQISRWVGVAGTKGRWKTNLCKKCLHANKRWDDVTVSPVVRQTMLHWAYEITEKDVQDVMKRM